MKTLKGLIIRVDSLLLLAILGIILGLSLSYERFSSKGTSEFERKAHLAAELLGHGLPHEAVPIMREAADSEPVSSRSLNLRRVLAEVLIDQIGDHEQALAQLIYLRAFSPNLASETEETFRHCMNRLGRVYDVQRRMLVDAGINPIENRVSTESVMRLGNEEGASVADVRERLSQMGVPIKNPPREVIEKVINGMAEEILLKRAAKRAGVNKRPAFLSQVRQFENNLTLQKFLEEDLLKDVSVEEQAINLFIENHKADFDSPLRVVHSVLAFSDESSAQSYVMGNNPATQPAVVSDHANAIREELPEPLRKISWETEGVKNIFGPIEIGGKFMVYLIHEVIPPKRVPPELAYQKARLQLLEQSQAGKIAETISELGKKEELKILDDVIQRNFYTASEPSPVHSQTGNGKGN